MPLNNVLLTIDQNLNNVLLTIGQKKVKLHDYALQQTIHKV